MEPTETLTAPAADAGAQQPTPPEESAGSAPAAADPQVPSFDMDDFIRGRAGVQGVDPSSKPGGVVPTAELDAAGDGESAPDPSGDVKPSDTPEPGTGRRGAAAEIARLKGENERLTRALDEATPVPPDASEETRKAILARETRFRDLNGRPDEDPTFLEGDNYAWLQEEKRKRQLVPELQRQYETVVAEDLKHHQDSFNSWVEGFRQHVLADMASAKDVPGVDLERVKAAPTFAARDRLMYEAGEARNSERVRALSDENAQLKRDLLAATRQPLGGGQTAPTGAVDIDTWIRQQAGVA